MGETGWRMGEDRGIIIITVIIISTTMITLNERAMPLTAAVRSENDPVYVYLYV